MLNQLVSKGKEDLANLETTKEIDQISHHLTNVLTNLQLRQQEPPSEGPTYEGLQLVDPFLCMLWEVSSIFHLGLGGMIHLTFFLHIYPYLV